METVGELLDRFVPVHFPKLARRTQVDNLRHVEALKALWGSVPADQLTARMIGQWMNGGPARGKIQRGKIVSLLATMYKYAVGEWFIVDSNPTRDLRMPKGNHRTRYITDAEFAAVRQIASPRLRAAMDLALLTGQRQGRYYPYTRHTAMPFPEEGLDSIEYPYIQAYRPPYNEMLERVEGAAC